MKDRQSFEDMKIYEACSHCEYFDHEKEQCKDKDIDCVWNDIEEDLEVLEIIKKKRVNIYAISKSVNAKDYNSINAPIERHLTEIEFNLIKEWLER